MLIGCVGFHVSAYRPTTEIKQCISVGRTAPELSVDAELRLISGRRRYSCKVTFSCTRGDGRSCHDVSTTSGCRLIGLFGANLRCRTSVAQKPQLPPGWPSSLAPCPGHIQSNPIRSFISENTVHSNC